MEKIHFLKELGDEKRTELLRKLDIPEQPRIDGHIWVNFIWSQDKLRIENQTYDVFTSIGYKNESWELNDYMVMDNKNGLDQGRLKILCAFMVENFGDTYRENAKTYLQALHKAKLREIEAKVAPEKRAANEEYATRLKLLK